MLKSNKSSSNPSLKGFPKFWKNLTKEGKFHKITQEALLFIHMIVFYIRHGSKAEIRADILGFLKAQHIHQKTAALGRTLFTLKTFSLHITCALVLHF